MSEAWSVDDIVLTETARDFQISPDGARAVWLRRKMDPDRGEYFDNLFLSSLKGAGEVQLTRGRESLDTARWSPDGTRIAFLSDRSPPAGTSVEAGSRQLWLIRADGGEPWRLTEHPNAIDAYAWAGPDSLLFTAAIERDDGRREKDTTRIVEDSAEEPPVRLFRVDSGSARVSPVSNNDDWIQALSVSPDGKWAITLHRRSLSYFFDGRVPPATVLTNLSTGEQRSLFDGTRRVPHDIEWATDSRGFYFVERYTSHPVYVMASISLLYYYDLATERQQQVDLQWENGLAPVAVEPTGDGFLALLADGVHFRPARYTKADDGWTMKPLTGSHAGQIFAWSAGAGGELVYEHSAADKLPQWYQATLKGAAIEQARPLTDLNEALAAKPVYRTEIVHWTGALDQEVEGLLFYPFGYQAGRQYPLVLSIHGGPTQADLDRWSVSWSQPKLLLAQEGAFVLEVNYHGSSGYGLDWVESIGMGRYYDLEIPDIEAGVDFLIERGLVDPDRLATMGWSNGSMLSTELVTRSSRYKALSAGAGVVEWISDWGTEDAGAVFDNYYYGASPLQDPGIYVRKSPFFRADKINTPTLIHHGEADLRVPPGQSWLLFRALQQLDRVEVRFLLYPGEPHGLLKYEHQRRKIEEDMAWFRKHLFNVARPSTEGLNE